MTGRRTESRPVGRRRRGGVGTGAARATSGGCGGSDRFDVAGRCAAARPRRGSAAAQARATSIRRADGDSPGAGAAAVRRSESTRTAGPRRRAPAAAGPRRPAAAGPRRQAAAAAGWRRRAAAAADWRRRAAAGWFRREAAGWSRREAAGRSRREASAGRSRRATGPRRRAAPGPRRREAVATADAAGSGRPCRRIAVDRRRFVASTAAAALCVNVY